MTARTSAGLLLFREVPHLEVLLGHMGGPYYARKDAGAWSIPKGEYDPDREDALVAARREFAEELGSPPPADGYVSLGSIVQRNRKIVTAWAAQGDFDTATLVSNTFELEWPPRSGRIQTFPETDRAAWFSIDDARVKIIAGQAELLDRLVALLADDSARHDSGKNPP